MIASFGDEMRDGNVCSRTSQTSKRREERLLGERVTQIGDSFQDQNRDPLFFIRQNKTNQDKG